MKIGDLVLVIDHNIKGKIVEEYDEERVVVTTRNEHEYLFLKKQLRVIKEKNHSTWR